MTEKCPRPEVTPQPGCLPTEPACDVEGNYRWALRSHGLVSSLPLPFLLTSFRSGKAPVNRPAARSNLGDGAAILDRSCVGDVRLWSRQSRGSHALCGRCACNPRWRGGGMGSWMRRGKRKRVSANLGQDQRVCVCGWEREGGRGRERLTLVCSQRQLTPSRRFLCPMSQVVSMGMCGLGG